MKKYTRFNKKNKFNAIKTKCLKGHYHPSRLEAQYCGMLRWQEEIGQIESYRTQVKYSMDVNGIHICNHYVDFEVTRNDGTIEVHETKGKETDLWRIKHRLFQALYPDLLYVIVK